MKNILGLKNGGYGYIISSCDSNMTKTMFIPTTKKFANARILEAHPEHVLVHWMSNYNVHGDFRTEIMCFDSELKLDKEFLEAQKTIRKNNGLIA